MKNLNDRVTFENKHAQQNYQIQFADVLIDKRYAFRELAVFPYSWLKKSTVSYEFLWNGIQKSTWQKLVAKVGLTKKQYKIWENQYGEGYWFTVFEDLGAAVALYDLLIKELPDYR